MKLNWSHITLTISTLTVVAVWVMSYVAVKNQNIVDIHYQIERTEGARNLIATKEVKSMMDELYALDIMTLPLRKIDIADIESKLVKDNRIYKTEVHIDAKREMHVSVSQRKPIMRIIDESGAQYYLDQEGKYVSKHDFKAIRVPVANGDIEAYDSNWSLKEKSRIKDCYQIVQALRKDDFLKALVEQIHVKDDRIIMIPKMGNERIVIKHLDKLDRKLNNLKVFYQTEMTKNNAWGKYKEIDISYYNQVLPRRRNP